MREYSGKDGYRRRKAAGLSDGARARPKPQSGRSRVAKLMARAGLCSRREAEAWIAQGRVVLNGVPLTNPAVNVTREDKIAVDGEPLARRSRTRLFLFHKPSGLVTTAHDPKGWPTIFDHLRAHWPDGPRVVTIGRLDINSEGLLLLTNDGGLARVLELPATGWIRRYRVRAKGETSQEILDGLREGITIEGMTYAGIEATLDRMQGANCWLTMALREGKNREVKRVLETIGLKVNRLIRLSFGPFQLGDLAEGAVEEVRTRVLRDQLGPSLAKAAGADFSSPLHCRREGKEAAAISNARPHPERSTPSRPAPHPRAINRPIDSNAGPKVKPAPRRRKYISALRAGYEEPPKARKRIERGETADRAGHSVQVERLVFARSEDKKREKRRAKKPAKVAEYGSPSSIEGRKEKAFRQGRESAAFGNRQRPRTDGQKPRRPRRKS